MLFGGPAEQKLGRRVVEKAGTPVLNLCGTLGLEEFGAVGQTLALFITPDTGPMHLAAWTGLRCLNLSMGPVTRGRPGRTRRTTSCSGRTWRAHAAAGGAGRTRSTA